MAGALEMVTLLLDSGADANPPGDGPLCEGSPLHLATRRRGEGVVKLLLERGADPMAIDRHGKTPVDYALARSKLSELLRKYSRPVETPGR